MPNNLVGDALNEVKNDKAGVGHQLRAFLDLPSALVEAFCSVP
jgi:hypothetical protein